MRPKSGLPKRKALRRMPAARIGFRDNPAVAAQRALGLDTSFPDNGNAPSVVSLFSGCGGLDIGFLGGFRFLGRLYRRLPFRIIHAYDNDEKAVCTYKLNLSDDVSAVDLTKVDLNTLPSADIVIGGFPCQDFSSCGPKTGLQGKRGELYSVMRDYMRAHSPMMVVAENVPYLEKLDNGRILDHIVTDLSSVGYRFKVWRLYCPDYGLPQNRTRLFLVGVRADIPGCPQPPSPTHVFRHTSIDKAISDLEGVEDESVPNQSQYFVATKATKGAGQGDQKSRRGEISYTVRANPKARVHFHYSLDRRLTVRECARLQSFPDEFVFPHATGHNVMQIGNAVPPIIGHCVAESILAFLRGLQGTTEKKGAEASLQTQIT